MRNLNKKNIKISLIISLLIIAIIAILSLIIDHFNEYYDLSATFVPGSVIATYIIILVHIFLMRKKSESFSERKILRNVLLFLFVSGFIIIITSLLIGGIKYNFSECTIVFSISLMPWLLVLSISYIYYIIRNTEI